MMIEIFKSFFLIFTVIFFSHICKAFPTIHFYSALEASSFLAQKDEFLSKLSTLDIALRMGSSKFQLDDFIRFTSQQSRDWRESEIQFVSRVIKNIENTNKDLGIKIKLPKELIFIRTTGQEEFAYPYTRRNAIILPFIPSEKTIYHEFFHILSRYNPNLQELLYKIAGFTKNSHFQIPIELKSRLITNPDAMNLDYVINVSSINNYYKVVPLNYSIITEHEIRKPVSDLSDVFSLKLITVEQDSQIFEVEETDYSKATRANSNYNIHPEEILAEHFSLLFYKIINDPNIIVDYADPINELLDILKK